MTHAQHDPPSDDAVRSILESARTIAIVGASSKPDRASHGIMKMLMGAGYHCIPVNPHESTVHGQPAYATLMEIPGRVDIVNVFRRAEHTPAIAQEAVAIHAKVLWLQFGISNQEAAMIARNAGLTVIMDNCIGVTMRRLGAQAPDTVSGQ